MSANCAAVIFDLDGTLLDTLPDIAAAANQVLSAQGAATFSLADYQDLVGAGVAMLFRRALPPKRRSEQHVAACIEQFGEVYEEHWNIRTQEFVGVSEMLAALVARNLRLAVLSNKPDRFTKKCVAEFLSAFPFNPVWGQRDGIPRKPDPAAAVDIARQLDVSPRDVLYVGDTSVDMQTAKRAGMVAVGALWGYRSRQELIDNGADVLISQPLDLLPAVDKVFN